MKLVFSFLLAASLLAQTNYPRLSGSNPSVDLGTNTYNVGTVRVFTGTGIPSSPTPLVPGVNAVRGDFYLDTTNTIFYQCSAVTCTASNQWQRAAYPTQVSVTAFGVNGSTSDAVNLQTALTAASGNFCLYVPTGLTINMANNHVSVPNTCISGDGPTNSKVQGSGLATPNVGMFDLVGTGSTVFRGIGFDGGVTVSVGVLYSTATSGGPQQNLLTTGSTFWLHGGVNNVVFDNVLVQHTGGYSVFADASMGNISNITVKNSIFQNNRPHLFGTSSLIYGSWTGGILFYNQGSTNSFTNVTVDNNQFFNDTGNCIWSQNTVVGVMNTKFSITNNSFVDTGLDCIQINLTTGLIETGNKSLRNGYVITSDLGASRVGGPLWLQNFPPSAFDGGVSTSNAIRSNNTAESFNGDFIDLDGSYKVTVIGNVGVSCFDSSDPLAASIVCGPSGNIGNNYERGITVSNSGAITSAGQFLVIKGNTITGVGNGGITAFGIQDSVIEGNTIKEAATNFSNPIVLGNLAGAHHATQNLVTANIIEWSPGSGAPAVFEDGSISAFISTDVNNVRGNFIEPFTNMFEFQKATPDISGTGNLTLSTVVGPSAGITAMVLQVEGTGGNPFLNFYLNNGSGTRAFTMSPGGAQPQFVTFLQLATPSIYPGSIVACSNCTATGGVEGGVCAGGGSSYMLAFSTGAAWKCF